ncbi:MAG: hypothetical protein EZS28_010772 [Streblomastix strix]|uniref:Uncharacterized protein n=1 Tax=Streblomastix strix TaxID=222440 RepID=A0A5J4WFQ1_9EUKA|nr:MAG: hypothetical protein EZS28_010772 [Streblomastix strix]
MAGFEGYDVQIHDSMRWQRCTSISAQDEEIKKISSCRKDDGRVERENKGKDLYKWVLGKRRISNLAILKEIEAGIQFSEDIYNASVSSMNIGKVLGNQEKIY